MVKIRKYFPINAPSYDIIEIVYINENQVRKTYRQVLLIVFSPHFVIASCRWNFIQWFVNKRQGIPKK